MASPWRFWCNGVLVLLGFPSCVRALAGQKRRAPEKFKIHDLGGTFGGTQFLRDALVKDMPDDLEERLAGCKVYIRGDYSDPRRRAHPPVADWGEDGRVWILVNGEPFWGDAINATAFQWLGPNDRLLMLGNWINESVAEAASDRMSSLWVPYASLYFADRHDRTPLDLLHPRVLAKSDASFLSSVQRSVDTEHVVAYLQHHCEDARETVWDKLNQELHAKTGHFGSALGRCNGKMQLGTQIRKLNQVDSEFSALDDVGEFSRADKTYDEAENMYKGFLFALTMENERNKVGYISEKIVNAYLSGVVPIYEGAAQIETVFNPESLLRVNHSIATVADHLANLIQNPRAYERYRSPTAGVVSEKSIRDFFSWHPAVWASHGDHLRTRILEEVASHCLEMQLQPALPEDSSTSSARISPAAEFEPTSSVGWFLRNQLGDKAAN